MYLFTSCSFKPENSTENWTEASRIFINTSDEQQFGWKTGSGSSGTKAKYVLSFTKFGHEMDKSQAGLLKMPMAISLRTEENFDGS